MHVRNSIRRVGKKKTFSLFKRNVSTLSRRGTCRVSRRRRKHQLFFQKSYIPRVKPVFHPSENVPPLLWIYLVDAFVSSGLSTKHNVTSEEGETILLALVRLSANRSISVARRLCTWKRSYLRLWGNLFDPG